MKSFNWNNNYETGLVEVDVQHKKLVNIINEYSSLLSTNSTTKNDIDATLKKLVDYTKLHFCDEEALMMNANIDSRHLLPHKKLHDDVINEISLLMSEALIDTPSAKTHILDLIIHWLAYHILGTDMNMARQVAAIKSGVSAKDAYDTEERNKDKSTEPLLDALNGLFSQVSLRNKELRELNESLENKIALRTTQLMDANKHFETLSLTDSLTGMSNRRHAMKQLSLLWDESISNVKPLACLMIDVDYFKSINDTYGHDVGDLFLVKLSEQLKYSIRNDDMACRLGGDEFFIICPNTDLKGALNLAEHINSKVSSLVIETQHKPMHVSISVGVGVNIADMNNFEALIKVADESVYLAKGSGRGCVRAVQSV